MCGTAWKNHAKIMAGFVFRQAYPAMSGTAWK